MIKPAASTADRPNRKKGFWIAYGAALWALTFGLLHVVWALGWYVGLDAEMAREAFARRWFLVYDLIAAGLCALAAAIAVALVQLPGRRLPRGLLGVLAWGCAGILVLRGAAGVIHLAILAAVRKDISSVLSFWDLWFCLGGILFAASVRRFWFVKKE